MISYYIIIFTCFLNMIIIVVIKAAKPIMVIVFVTLIMDCMVVIIARLGQCHALLFSNHINLTNQPHTLSPQ